MLTLLWPAHLQCRSTQHVNDRHALRSMFPDVPQVCGKMGRFKRELTRWPGGRMEGTTGSHEAIRGVTDRSNDSSRLTFAQSGHAACRCLRGLKGLALPQRPQSPQGTMLCRVATDMGCLRVGIRFLPFWHLLPCFLAQLQIPPFGQADSGLAFGIFLNPWKSQSRSFSLVQKHAQGDELRNLCKK